MKSRGKANKFFSLILTIVMVLGLLPAGVMATTSDITVSVSVYDYTAVTYGTDHASKAGMVLGATEVVIANNSTALDAIKLALDKESIPYTVNSQYNYISSVNNLSEFDCGSQSGWVFSINDDFGNMGAAATTLSAGDNLKLHYSVSGYGTDVGSYFAGGPAITKLTLGNTDTVISSHTVYADANDYTGTTTYYLGNYKEGGDNTPLSGMGTLSSPFVIPIKLPASTDITNLTAKVESTLHPQYISYGIGEGITDISKAANYENDVTLCLQTIGGYKKTYYTISVTKDALPLPNYTGDWINFRGNEQNMGITTAKTPKTADSAMLKWAVKYSSGWSEAITPPILLNDYLYIAKGKKIVKINPDNGELLIESKEMVGGVGYALNPITYGGGMIFVPVGNGQVQALRADTLESLWVSEKLGGQTLTPITYKNGYIYTGTWNSETKVGTYFCLSVADEDVSQTNEIKNCTWKLDQKGGFYWAGAYATDNYVIFGSDDGDAGNTSKSAVLYSVNPITGTVIDTIENITGDIRSTVSYDSETDRVYFTTKGGEFYQVKVNGDGTFDDSKTKIFVLGGMCTGTPLVYNGLAYLGVSGPSQFSQTGHSYKIIDVTTSPMKEVGFAQIPGYVQTSALLSTAYNANTNKVYVYATYNYTPGGIYVIEVEKTGAKDADGAAVVNTSGSHLFTPEGDKAQYCICSLVSDRNGVIYYKNDSGYLMAVAPKPLSEKSITAFNIGSNKGTINEATKTIAVTVAYNTDVKSLAPVITISDKASVNPASGISIDFTNPVTYTVTAEDGSIQEYVVTVTKRTNSGGGGGSADELSTERTRAKASLLEAFNKCLQSDYITDNWNLVKSAYNTGVADIEKATSYNSVYEALNRAIDAIGKIEIKSSSTITVCVSMEKFSLGQGYIIEPMLVNVSKYTPASVVITDLIKQKYPSISQPYRMTGSVTDGFYLSYVYDTNTDVNVPGYILSALGGSLDTRGSNNLLGEFDYSQWSGWMYSINGEFPGVGASSWRLSNKEVMRWQFTLYGYGADLNADNKAWGQSSLKSLADKDALTWRVAEINGMSNKAAVLAAGSNQSKYDTAMAVLTKIDSTQTEVDNALSELNNLASVGGSSGGGSGSGTPVSQPVSQITAPVVNNDDKVISQFTDTDEIAWAKGYISYLAEKGIVKGKTETTFAPNEHITRAEFVAILSRISAAEANETVNGFTDVTATDWFANYVAWAVKAGITNGVSDTSFAPNDNISRQDMASMLARFAKHMNFTLPATIEEVSFLDNADVADYAKAPVSAMQMAGIINGKDDNKFMPMDYATRAESCKMIAILMQLMEK